MPIAMKRLAVATDPRYLAELEPAITSSYEAIYVFDEDSARTAAGTEIDGIVANVIFDEGAVFNFISFVRGTFPHLPVMAVKPALEGPPMEPAIGKAFEIATKSVGAWDYIDFDAPSDGNMASGADRLTARIAAMLDAEERAKSARHDRRTLGSHQPTWPRPHP